MIMVDRMSKHVSRQDAKPAKENQNKVFLAFFAPLRETGSQKKILALFAPLRETGSQKASSPGNLIVGRSQE